MLNESEIIAMVSGIIQNLPKYGNSSEDLIYQETVLSLASQEQQGTILKKDLYLIVPNTINAKNIRSRYIKPNPYNSIFYVK